VSVAFGPLPVVSKLLITVIGCTQICGASSVFGEEIATHTIKVGGSKAAGSKGAVDANKDGMLVPRCKYSVRMQGQSEVYFIPRQVLDDFFPAGNRRRQEMKKALFDRLTVLASGRQMWITPAVSHVPYATLLNFDDPAHHTPSFAVTY
jgi:hypothetical protein